MSTFSENLKEALNNSGMRPLDLSNRTGISKSAISHYMAGHFIPKHDKLAALASALGVSVEWLLGVEKELYVPEDQIILAQYNALNDAGRQKLLEYADDLLRTGKYQKQT